MGLRDRYLAAMQGRHKAPAADETTPTLQLLRGASPSACNTQQPLPPTHPGYATNAQRDTNVQREPGATGDATNAQRPAVVHATTAQAALLHASGAPADCAALDAVAWTDADIARFLDRRARLLRWGWAEPEAEKLAERLVRRDREADPRVSCTDCRHYRPGRCGDHRAAGLDSAELGSELAAMLQRCPGFQPAR